MDPFAKSYWSRLQVPLWIVTRSRRAVRLAGHPPGTTRLLDLDEEEPDYFDSEGEVIDAAIFSCCQVVPVHDARRELIAAEQDGRLRRYEDAGGAGFCSQADVLGIWAAKEPEDAMKATYWTLWQAVVWVCTREAHLVQEAPGVWPSGCWLDSAAGAAKALEGSSPEEQPDEGVAARIVSGELPVLGRRNGQGGREAIPEEERVGLEVEYRDGDVVLRHTQKHAAPWWGDLICEREAVLALWPDPGSEMDSGRSNASPAPKPIRKRGRKPGVGSFANADASLIQTMREMLGEGIATSTWQAALAVAERAAGGGTIESKARRLLMRFSENFDE